MGLLPDYKEWIELAKKAGNVEAQEQILALREEHLRLREELIQVREENGHLKAKLDAATTIEFESPSYWKVTPECREGPFCQCCWDTQDRLVRLQPRSTRGWWDCYSCKNHFTDKNYVEPYRQSRATTDDSWRV